MCKHFLSVIFLVLFLLFQSTFLYSLSEDEKQVLPKLSKSVLIEIILTYDDQMNSSEKTIQNLEKSLTELQILHKKDSTQLKIQEDLFQTSLQLQKEKDSKVIRNYFIVGGVSILLGMITEYVIETSK